MSERQVTQFEGVSSAPGSGAQHTRGPYEFFTAGEVRVYLHDADLLAVTWQPDCSLRFRFAYDRAWTPDEARDTPIIELTFHQTHILRWTNDMKAAAEGDFLGEVRDFAWDGGNAFTMVSHSLDLAFTAARMSVLLAPATSL